MANKSKYQLFEEKIQFSEKKWEESRMNLKEEIVKIKQGFGIMDFINPKIGSPSEELIGNLIGLASTYISNRGNINEMKGSIVSSIGKVVQKGVVHLIVNKSKDISFMVPSLISLTQIVRKFVHQKATNIEMKKKYQSHL